MREFEERELGINLKSEASKATVEYRNGDYALVSCLVKNLAIVARNADANVRPKSTNAFAPFSINVIDWEVGEVRLCPLSMLDFFLGFPEPISDKAKKKILTAKQFSQAINWYKDMAVCLKTRSFANSG